MIGDVLPGAYLDGLVIVGAVAVEAVVLYVGYGLVEHLAGSRVRAFVVDA
ncbi:MAG: hypothetical protein ACLFMX_07265 [Halobacteriales archaeon]